MKAGRLLEIIEEISQRDNLTLSDIAVKANVNRSYLSKFINGDQSKDMTRALERKFTKCFPDYFKEGNKSHENAARKIIAQQVLSTPNPAKDLSASYIALMEERIRELKEDKEWLKSQIESNLNAIYVGVKSNQAHQVAILQYTTLRDMKGDEAKAQKAMDSVGKHAAEILNGRRDTVLKSNS